MGVDGAHCDCGRIIARAGDSPVNPSVFIFAEISGRYHNHDPVLDARFHGLAERIGFVGFENRMAQRKIAFHSDSWRVQYRKTGERPGFLVSRSVRE